MAETTNASVMIVAQSGRMRDGLRALLRAIPNIAIVGQADNYEAALQIVTHNQPDLLLCGSNLPLGEVEQLVKTIKTRWPTMRCVVLMDNIEQLICARTAGADSVLLAGFSSTLFFSTIEDLLLPQTQKI